MTPHPDHRFLKALKEGDSAVLKELYTQFAPKVIHWVRQNKGDLADAEDVFQEALMALYNKACDPVFILKYPIGGLLFQICKNKWIDTLRKKNRETEVRKQEHNRYTLESNQLQLIEEIEEEALRQERLDRAFSKLSVLCQQVMRLIAAGVSPKDIAKQLGMTDANTVYRRKKACIDRWQHFYAL